MVPPPVVVALSVVALSVVALPAPPSLRLVWLVLPSEAVCATMLEPETDWEENLAFKGHPRSRHALGSSGTKGHADPSFI